MFWLAVIFLYISFKSEQVFLFNLNKMSLDFFMLLGFNKRILALIFPSIGSIICVQWFFVHFFGEKFTFSHFQRSFQQVRGENQLSPTDFLLKVLKNRLFWGKLPYEQLKSMWKLLKKGLFMGFFEYWYYVETIYGLKNMNRCGKIVVVSDVLSCIDKKESKKRF